MKREREREREREIVVHLPVGSNDQEHGRGLDAKVLEHVILPLLDMAKLHPPCIVHGQSFQQHRWRLVVLGEEVSIEVKVSKKARTIVVNQEPFILLF